MIPQIETLLTPIQEVTYQTKTYKVILDKDRINGYTDEVDALIQTIYFILNTERYKYIIYSWDYGVELFDLFGKQMTYVISEVERRITEALIQDDRILEVTNFEFESKGHKLSVTFDVISIYGTIQADKMIFE
jgi:hypothetical protein